MEDSAILELYWRREEQAIGETAEKYGPYCGSIARQILADAQDVDECLNDTWLAAWNSIPPQRPARLSTYLGRLTRNRALDRLRALSARKRGGGEAELVLEELSECIAAPGRPEDAVEAEELGRAVNRFLATLEKTERDVFVSRCFFFRSLDELSQKTGFSRSKLKSMLFHTRKKLAKHLRKEGYC